MRQLDVFNCRFLCKHVFFLIGNKEILKFLNAYDIIYVFVFLIGYLIRGLLFKWNDLIVKNNSYGFMNEKGQLMVESLKKI